MTDRVQKFFQSLDKKTQNKLKKRLIQLKKSPFKGSDIKKLKGYNNQYRLRFGKIRIIYEVIDKETEIIDIDYRGNVY